ncbi:hypothetical protein HPB51_024251 [Rhipicephalus microplus]|uniref:Uncharacterized protein n=1 Tax=Rhipicephalus microplus TaxID=6941 RepID=A0A9J6DYD0_RHIMP|nr:hypothetical protein HPB51_024251 [Rhipicephalus microplus]
MFISSRLLLRRADKTSGRDDDLAVSGAETWESERLSSPGVAVALGRRGLAGAAALRWVRTGASYRGCARSPLGPPSISGIAHYRAGERQLAKCRLAPFAIRSITHTRGELSPPPPQLSLRLNTGEPERNRYKRIQEQVSIVSMYGGGTIEEDGVEGWRLNSTRIAEMALCALHGTRYSSRPAVYSKQEEGFRRAHPAGPTREARKEVETRGGTRGLQHLVNATVRANETAGKAEFATAEFSFLFPDNAHSHTLNVLNCNDALRQCKREETGK